MNIIKQSACILVDSGNHIRQIADRASICYQAEPREDHIGFVKGMVKSGHLSTLEMADIHISIPIGTAVRTGQLSAFTNCKYLINTGDKNNLIISGSIRAWYEVMNTVRELKGVSSVVLNSTNDLHNVFDAEWVGISGAKILEEIPEPLRLKHERVCVKFVTNRAMSHQLVRHRPVGILMESQRYCNYSKGKFGSEVAFIRPLEDRIQWAMAMLHAEKVYFELLKSSLSPQQARDVLPNAAKTELLMMATHQEWSHIFKLRTHKTADPMMRDLMRPLLDKFRCEWPEYYTNLERSEG